MRRRRVASTRLALVSAALAAGACAGALGPAAREPSDAAKLVLRCDVADAAVWVDGDYVGEVRRLRGGFSVEPGSRRVEVRHDDYHTYYARLALEPRERRAIDVYLARRLE